ncbi:hypothetical protein IDH44_06285 [Paenibacillus sp. IB182496]|uniref:DUF559 domain-containing protein n=1 Tax=Paenibacillus sabuli TaxID=2772509 RepID=A0A927BSU3_9BACL|nr:hypothetical protein [Paenibacillus sabuli]MBD2844793.1 hypothetical protein [Paenibacillus sabuli]
MQASIGTAYEQAHSVWLEHHLTRRTGERRDRLARGHGHGEQLFLETIWWPIRRSLDDLHPEYEVLDWRGRPYYADFAWLPGQWKVIWEIKGYGPHVREMDRRRYCEELNRETFLQALGFRVVSIAYDDLAHRPEAVQSLIRLFISRYLPEQPLMNAQSLIQRETLLLAHRLGRAVRPRDVELQLAVNHRTAVRCLQQLCASGHMRPSRPKQGTRICSYTPSIDAIQAFDRL